MSYDLELVNSIGETMTVQTPFLMHGGTVPAAFGSDNRLHQIPQRGARMNITYNYARYYYEQQKVMIDSIVKETKEFRAVWENCKRVFADDF